jgi:DNA-binding CsgD family transcriptional regulator
MADPGHRSPHLAAFESAPSVFDQARTVFAADGDAAVLLDSRGVIAAANPAARARLDRWFPGWSDRRMPPPSVQAWLRAHQVASEPVADLVLHGVGTRLQIRRIPLDDMDILLIDEIRLGPLTDQLTALGLTPREAEVVLIVAEGETVARTARRLGISTRTVEKHIQLAYDKLGVHNRASAAKLVSDLLHHSAATPTMDQL